MLRAGKAAKPSPQSGWPTLGGGSSGGGSSASKSELPTDCTDGQTISYSAGDWVCADVSSGGEANCPGGVQWSCRNGLRNCNPLTTAGAHGETKTFSLRSGKENCSCTATCDNGAWK